MKCYVHPEIEAVATCTNCGKAICQTCSVDVSGRVICQNCLASGNLTRPPIQAIQPAKPTNALAIVSLILGILGLCGGFLFSIPAWITGYFALKQIAEDQNQEGAQLANVGKWLGIVITILYGVVLLLYIIFVVFFSYNNYKL
jgi:hypothetical protein